MPMLTLAETVPSSASSVTGDALSTNSSEHTTIIVPSTSILNTSSNTTIGTLTPTQFNQTETTSLIQSSNPSMVTTNLLVSSPIVSLSLVQLILH